VINHVAFTGKISYETACHGCRHTHQFGINVCGRSDSKNEVGKKRPPAQSQKREGYEKPNASTANHSLDHGGYIRHQENPSNLVPNDISPIYHQNVNEGPMLTAAQAAVDMLTC
jgi:hypothetical protein